MKDEIKEIIRLNCDEEIDVKYFAKNDSIVDTTMDYSQLLDYITNLQERCEYLERSNNRREDDILYKRQEISDLEDKIYKAIEKILSLKNKLYSEPPLWLEELQDILEGSVK